MAAATQWDQGDANRSVAPGSGPDASPDAGHDASPEGGRGTSPGAAVRLDAPPLATPPDDVL